MAAGLDKIREIAERVAQSSGLELVDLELSGGGKARMLRVFIDKPGGVTHEDCANFARDFGTVLDVEDLIPGAEYTLEVSSPGLERKLLKPADYERFRGSLAKVQTFTAIENNRHFTGRLTAFDGKTMTLDLSAVKQKGKAKKALTAQTVEISLANVEKANLLAEI